MLKLINLLARRVAGLFAAQCPSFEPDSLTLRDWADLPAHHPLADRAPC